MYTTAVHVRLAVSFVGKNLLQQKLVGTFPLKGAAPLRDGFTYFLLGAPITGPIETIIHVQVRKNYTV